MFISAYSNVAAKKKDNEGQHRVTGGWWDMNLIWNYFNFHFYCGILISTRNAVKTWQVGRVGDGMYSHSSFTLWIRQEEFAHSLLKLTYIPVVYLPIVASRIRMGGWAAISVIQWPPQQTTRVCYYQTVKETLHPRVAQLNIYGNLEFPMTIMSACFELRQPLKASIISEALNSGIHLAAESHYA